MGCSSAQVAPTLAKADALLAELVEMRDRVVAMEQSIGSAPPVPEASGSCPARAERTRAPRARQHSRSLPDKPLTRRERAEGELLHLEVLPQRPATRAACAGVPRPCVFVSCRWNLFLEVTAAGSVKLLHGDVEPDDRPAALSCVLDIAEREGTTLDMVGHAMSVTRERVRQIETKALKAVSRRGARLAEVLDRDPPRRSAEAPNG